MPGAFEIASNEVTVGRVAEKADLVIPVATVSGLHAKIQKKGGNLVVTDLDSTNGTFIGKSRLKPGLPYTLTPGNFVIFGDIHLAMFRVSKLENAEVATSSSSSSSAETEEETEETETSVEATSS
ncbi:Zeaxanthin epoxidase, chloroplastic [Linum perenne]